MKVIVVADKAALQKLNAILTSFSQFAENCRQLCSWIGAAGGKTPPPRIRMSGVRTSNTFDGAFSSVASSARVWTPETSSANCWSGASCRATARTCAPLRMPASTMRRPIPRLPPMTTIFFPSSEIMLFPIQARPFARSVTTPPRRERPRWLARRARLPVRAVRG